MQLDALFRIAGKTALVTGGSRGLGLFVADGFVRAGVKVYISSRKAEVCDQVAAELSQVGECVSLPADLSRHDEVLRLASELRAREAKLDILVNNAGATWGAPIEDFPEIGWDRVMDLNVKSVFFLTQQLLPLLRAAGTAQDPARVVNIGSVAGLHAYGSGTTFSYNASKAALHHLTRTLAARLAADHVNVNAIAPGPFATKMMAYALDDVEHRAEIERSIPQGRIGQPADMLGLAGFLCSPASAYITGVVVPLDGGATGCQ